jgi:hypothetical protein
VAIRGPWGENGSIQGEEDIGLVTAIHSISDQFKGKAGFVWYGCFRALRESGYWNCSSNSRDGPPS